VKEQIQALVQLQDIDDQANKVQIELEEGRAKLTSLETDLQELAEKISIRTEEMQAVQKRQRELEGEIEAAKALAERSRERLSSIKSNREYKALLREIDDGSKRITEMEEEVMEIMTQVEETQKVISGLEEEKKAVATAVEDEAANVSSRSADVEKKLKTFESSRAKICASVEPQILSRYNLILRNRDSMAMAAVEDAVCKACHMGIPPQTYNELQVGDRLLFCPHCDRILYWRKPEEE
jgi:predicted  nucleic acid-binding Zn-ribbon protein